MAKHIIDLGHCSLLNKTSRQAKKVRGGDHPTRKVTEITNYPNMYTPSAGEGSFLFPP